MALNISRRSLFLGGLLTLAAPAVGRASALMPIKDPRLVRGILLARDKTMLDAFGKPPESRAAFAPLESGYESRSHETVWLCQDDPLVLEYNQIARQTHEHARIADLMTLEERASRPRSVYGRPIEGRVRRPHDVDFAAAVRSALAEPRLYVTGSP